MRGTHPVRRVQGLHSTPIFGPNRQLLGMCELMLSRPRFSFRKKAVSLAVLACAAGCNGPSPFDAKDPAASRLKPENGGIVADPQRFFAGAGATGGRAAAGSDRHDGGGNAETRPQGRNFGLPARRRPRGSIRETDRQRGLPGRLVRDSPGRFRVRGAERDAQARSPAGPGDSGRAGPHQADAVQVRVPALDRAELHARAEQGRAVRVRDAARTALT